MAGSIEVGSTIAGYRLVAMIGRGGMGVVYRADQPELGRQVAVKLIAPEFARDEGFRERFRRESRLAATIEHPNAIPIYDAGVTGDEVLYLAMRYVEGTDMRTLISTEGALEPRRAVGLIEQVAGALDEAHAHGLVHRDVKPGNVLVAQQRGREHAYLTDFGLTKDISRASQLTATGQWVGTVDYACPEQIEGKRVDARADVYALGCVLFEALTGRVPFDRDSELAKLFAHANEDPPRPSELVRGLPVGLDEVVARSLAKDPDERFPSAGDLGRAASAAAVGAEVAAPERTVAAGAAAPAAGGADAGAIPPPPAPTAPGREGEEAGLPDPGASPPSEPTVAPREPEPSASEPAPFPSEPTVSSREPAPPVSEPARPPSEPTVASSEPAVRAPGSTAAGQAAAAGASGLPTDVSTEAGPAAHRVADQPRPPERATYAQRRFPLLPVGAVAAVIAAAVAVAFAAGLFGGADEAAAVEFETVTPGGAYQVDLPVGWTVEDTETPQRGPTHLRTTRLSADGNVRVGINRFVGEGRDPEAQASEAHEENLAVSSYERLSGEPVEIGDKDAWLSVFEREWEDLGPGRAWAYFFSLGGDAYKVQGSAATGGGAEARRLASAVAERAAASLRGLGG